MAVKAKYEAPLQVVETKEMRDRIVAIADAEDISQAQVCRDMFRYAIEWREQAARERAER